MRRENSLFRVSTGAVTASETVDATGVLAPSSIEPSAVTEIPPSSSHVPGNFCVNLANANYRITTSKFSGSANTMLSIIFQILVTVHLVKMEGPV